ncbi:MAG: hypothetical protein ACK4WF_00495 [Candidatus Brocadiales bacterium]
MGIFSRKKAREKRAEEPPVSCMEIEIFPLNLVEGNMINALLEAMQEVSGLVVTSRLAERIVGVLFVVGSLISGIALLITVMYLASPEGFEKRLQRVLVEKPVVEAPAKGKAAEAEGSAEEKTAKGSESK